MPLIYISYFLFLKIKKTLRYQKDIVLFIISYCFHFSNKFFFNNFIIN